MAAITSGAYFRHKLEKRIAELMLQVSEEAMLYPEDGGVYWERVGKYQALRELLGELSGLDQE